jgi:hypothetical protein
MVTRVAGEDCSGQSDDLVEGRRTKFSGEVRSRTAREAAMRHGWKWTMPGSAWARGRRLAVVCACQLEYGRALGRRQDQDDRAMRTSPAEGILADPAGGTLAVGDPASTIRQPLIRAKMSESERQSLKCRRRFLC